MNRRSSLPVAVVTLLAAAAVALAAEAKTWTTVRIATEGAHPPFNFIDANGQAQGFEVEVGKALCESAGLACSFVVTDWESLIPGLKAERHDAILASLSITDERRRKIAFTERYYRTPYAFAARKDEGRPRGTTPDDLKGRTIGAQDNSLAAPFLEDLYKDSTVKLYASLEEASLDLAVGRIDAVLGDKFMLAEWLAKTREGSCCAFIGDAPDRADYFGEGYGIGVRKQDADLKALLDKAIVTIKANGVYDAIRARYFAFDVR